jgi:hypothetical protein
MCRSRSRSVWAIDTLQPGGRVAGGFKTSQIEYGLLINLAARAGLTLIGSASTPGDGSISDPFPASKNYFTFIKGIASWPRLNR